MGTESEITLCRREADEANGREHGCERGRFYLLLVLTSDAPAGVGRPRAQVAIVLNFSFVRRFPGRTRQDIRGKFEHFPGRV